MIRSWIKLHPVTMSNIKNGTPAMSLLSKEPRFVAIASNYITHQETLAFPISSIADFATHPRAIESSSVKLVRYQQNPTPNWGPGSRAGGKTKRKRKRIDASGKDDYGTSQHELIQVD